MKVFKGTEKLARFHSTDLEVDFDHLFEFKGQRKIRNNLERQIARIAFFLGTLILLFSLLIFFTDENFSLKRIISPNSLSYVFPYFSIFFFTYASYLTRKRDEATNISELKDLNDSFKLIKENKLSKLTIDKYFTEDVLETIDKLYFTNNEKFLGVLSDYLLSGKAGRDIIEKRIGINLSSFKNELFKRLNDKNLSFDVNYHEISLRSFSAGLDINISLIDERAFLIAFSMFYWKETLESFNIGNFELQGLKEWFRNQIRKENYKKDWDILSKFKPQTSMNRAYTAKATHMLDHHGKDLTLKAARGDFLVTLGKDEAMINLLRNLQKERNSRILLLGDPGVGKSSLLKYLATRMTVEDVPEVLKDMRLVSINLNQIMTKSLSIDHFKEEILRLLNEAKNATNVILIIEEIDQMFTLRNEGRLEVINLITNLLSESDSKIIATSNFDSFVKRIKPNKSFASLFDIVELKEPDSNISFQILMDEVPKLESKYAISIQTNAVKRIVEFASKISFERSMPDKGLVFLEESIIQAKTKNLNFVSEDIVDELLKSKIGINVGNISKDESEVLINLEKEMHKRVIGQDQAITAIASALRRSRAGMGGGKKPVASFLFYGPTGVGKTEVAKTLAELYYGSENLMVRIDMSEYQEEKNLDRLIGYTDLEGNFIGGYLTEAVRNRPYTLVLLDELEKANLKVLDLFLQILDEGNVTDGLGRKVDFSNTIIIATSNAASREVANLVVEGLSYHEIEVKTAPKLREVYRVEFLNRFDKVIMFKSLTKLEIEKICEILLNKLKRKLENERNIRLEWDSNLLKELAEIGYNPMFGARELKRVVSESIEDRLATLIISRELTAGKKVVFNGLNDTKVI